MTRVLAMIARVTLSISVSSPPAIHAGLAATPMQGNGSALPARLYYSDFTPRHVHLGHPATRARQDVICALQEGCRLHLVARKDGGGWLITTDTGVAIGGMSLEGTSELAGKKISASHFTFQPGEVTLRAIFHHVKVNDVTGDVLEDWFVPIPQLRVCR